jgi:hypothetical protein
MLFRATLTAIAACTAALIATASPGRADDRSYLADLDARGVPVMLIGGVSRGPNGAVDAGYKASGKLRNGESPAVAASQFTLICPRRFEPWLCELKDGMGGCPEHLVLCRADVTEVAVAAFDVVEVVDVVGHGRRKF